MLIDVSKNVKGVRPDAIDKEVEETLKDVDLTSKANTQAINLSGGQKRKLSIGVALIGDPKVSSIIPMYTGIVNLNMQIRLCSLTNQQPEWILIHGAIYGTCYRSAKQIRYTHI